MSGLHSVSALLACTIQYVYILTHLFTYIYICTCAHTRRVRIVILPVPQKTLRQINNLLREWKSQQCHFFYSHAWKSVHRPFPIANEGDRYFQIFLLTVMETEIEANIFLQVNSFPYARPCIAIHLISWLYLTQTIPTLYFL